MLSKGNLTFKYKVLVFQVKSCFNLSTGRKACQPCLLHHLWYATAGCSMIFCVVAVSDDIHYLFFSISRSPYQKSKSEKLIVAYKDLE